MKEERMYVKSVICGKGILMKKLDIKGRGRMGIIKVPKCSIKVQLEEKSTQEFFKMNL
jgi:ribosomal protein L22